MPRCSRNASCGEQDAVGVVADDLGYVRCMNASLLWLIAVVVAVVGVVQLLQGQILFGILLLVLACAIGPAGWSMWGRRDV